jgi:hypothetical protein
MATPTMAAAANDMTQLQRVVCALAFFLLFLGIGRVASLVLHDPLLGYANSYDMIRLQACHQIWPADKGIDITDGTPQAPLRRYTLGRQLDTPCFPSSELLFTGSGIALAQLKNLVTGESLVSLKMIGSTKAAFLTLTALLASLYFYRQRLLPALLANGLVMAGVLADPGITLYLNTFYTEFSAVYFLYLALVGLVVAGTAPRRWFYTLPLLAGLVGLGLSKPQHLPLALLLGTLAGVWLWRQPWRPVALLAVLCGALPLALQLSGHWVPRNDNMAVINRSNVLSAALQSTDEPGLLLTALELPDSCMALRDRYWYVDEPVPTQLCPPVANLTDPVLYLRLLREPATVLGMLAEGIPASKEWIFNGYGQVEGARKQLASAYQQTLYLLLPDMPEKVYNGLFLASLLLLPVPAALWLGKRPSCVGPWLFPALAVSLCWAVLLVAVLGDGFYDLGKHSHLCLPLLLAAFLLTLNNLAQAGHQLIKPTGREPGTQ